MTQSMFSLTGTVNTPNALFQINWAWNIKRCWSWGCDGSTCERAYYSGLWVKPFRALIGCLVDANPFSSCACLYFGPCNRGGHFITCIRTDSRQYWLWQSVLHFVSSKLHSDLVEVGTVDMCRSRCVWTLSTGSTVSDRRLGLRQIPSKHEQQ